MIRMNTKNKKRVRQHATQMSWQTSSTSWLATKNWPVPSWKTSWPEWPTQNRTSRCGLCLRLWSLLASTHQRSECAKCLTGAWPCPNSPTLRAAWPPPRKRRSSGSRSWTSRATALSTNTRSASSWTTSEFRMKPKWKSSSISEASQATTRSWTSTNSRLLSTAKQAKTSWRKCSLRNPRARYNNSSERLSN